MDFTSVADIVRVFARLGAERVYCKLLAENDNTKQQIYLGNSFEVLQLLNYGEIRTDKGAKRPNFKASLNFEWIDTEGNAAPAPGAQLILYPDYPEVRLSGFLRGCALAPSKHLQPLPAEKRQFNNGHDGRVLFLGVSSTRILASLAVAGSPPASEIMLAPPPAALLNSEILREISFVLGRSTKELLLEQLRAIICIPAPWHNSSKLDSMGISHPYIAKNGGGYTLEALLGIIPNGRSAPDYLGWEIKAFAISRITLMTPEPDAGYYGEFGAEAFLRKYGRRVREDTLYFTGAHYVGRVCPTTGQTLKIIGFDPESGKITDVAGGIQLMDSNGEIAAEWTFGRLMEHWGRKHAAAAYVPYMKSIEVPPRFRYKSPVLIGQGTDFQLFLSALAAGAILYDPGPKLENASGPRSRIKARSQFRINVNQLRRLYLEFGPVNL